jgi:oligopeptide transport system ATP-binding protein
VDLELPRGKTLAIVGESGGGKSVTAKAIMGILSSNGAIDSGEILFTPKGEGTLSLEKLSKKQFRKTVNGTLISMVFQDPMTSLDPTMSIGKQIIEGILAHQKVSNAEANRQAVELLRLVEIAEPEKRMKNYPHQLSGGMRQRVVIAIAISNSPQLLICDEPTTALDVTIQAKILDIIRSIQESMGISTIYITHDLGVVANVADFVAVMYAGKIVEKGTADEVFYDPRHPYTWGLLSAMPSIDVKEEELYTIPGSPPSLIGEVIGDAFAPRNAYSLNIDSRIEPPMFKVSQTHSAATWLLHESAPKIGPPKALAERLEIMRRRNG